MPRQSDKHRDSTQLCLTILFLVLFLVAFFPSAFVSLLALPLTLVFPSPPTSPPLPPAVMSWTQKTLHLPARSKGAYLITSDVTAQLPELAHYRVGLLHLFLQHTSCALSLNENWDEDVRLDMSDALDRVAPEDKKGAGLYRHDAEGRDDMPVHSRAPVTLGLAYRRC